MKQTKGWLVAGLVLLMAALVTVGCATGSANWAERMLYQVQTNYTPVVVVQTNVVTVTNQVEVPVVSQRVEVVTVTNAVGVVVVQTNVATVTITNTETRISLATNTVTVTNVVASTALGPSPGAQATLGTIGSTLGGFIGMPGVGSTVLLGAYTIFMHLRNRKTQAALAQGVEVGRELLNTPALKERYTAWLVQHQAAAGVLGTVSKLVNTVVDNKEAKGVAADLVKPG